MSYLVKLFDETGNLIFKDYWKASSIQVIILLIMIKIRKFETEQNMENLSFEVLAT